MGQFSVTIYGATGSVLSDNQQQSIRFYLKYTAQLVANDFVADG